MLCAHSSYPGPEQAAPCLPGASYASVGKVLIAALPPALSGLGSSLALVMAGNRVTWLLGGQRPIRGCLAVRVRLAQGSCSACRS